MPAIKPWPVLILHLEGGPGRRRRTPSAAALSVVGKTKSHDIIDDHGGALPMGGAMVRGSTRGLSASGLRRRLDRTMMHASPLTGGSP